MIMDLRSTTLPLQQRLAEKAVAFGADDSGAEEHFDDGEELLLRFLHVAGEPITYIEAREL